MESKDKTPVSAETSEAKKNWWRKLAAWVGIATAAVAGVAAFTGGIQAIKDNIYKLFGWGENSTEMSIRDVYAFRPIWKVVDREARVRITFVLETKGRDQLLCDGQLRMNDENISAAEADDPKRLEYVMKPGRQQVSGTFIFYPRKSHLAEQAAFRVECSTEDLRNFYSKWEPVRIQLPPEKM